MRFKVLFISALLCYTFSFAQEITWDPKESFSTKVILSKSNGGPLNILLNNPVQVSDHVIVPNWVTLQFADGGRLVIANDSTQLEIQGRIRAPKRQIFDLSKKGVVSYRYESVSNIKLSNTPVFYPEWWGVYPNIIPGKNGDTEGKQRHHSFLKEMMLDVASSGGGTIQFSEGVYYIRDIVVDSDNVKVKGMGDKTILRFDRDNYGFSTRRGGIFTIQGPTTGRYYSKIFPDGKPIAGNYQYGDVQKPISNIEVKDLVIEWNETSTKEDPAMNGLTIVNAQNVLIENVHVNLFGANRAFYVGVLFDGDITKNITIKNSSCENSRTGVFILHGFMDSNFDKKELRLGDISIEGNYFKLVGIPELDVKNEHLTIDYLDPYGSGVFFIGSEYTQSFESGGVQYVRELGPISIINNTIENADFGIRSWHTNQDENKRLTQKVRISNNRFKNFKYVGVFSPFEFAEITGNTFEVSQLPKLPAEVKDENEEGFVASAIHIAKAPWKIYHNRYGPSDVTIQGNTIEGCYLGVTPILVQPKEEGMISIIGNNILYDSSCQNPSYDIEIMTSRRLLRTKKATINLGENTARRDNQTNNQASIYLNVRREKHIEIINK